MDEALTFIHICVDSSQTVLEHHRSFIPSTLYISKPAEREKVLGQSGIPLSALRAIDNPIPKLVLEESAVLGDSI